MPPSAQTAFAEPAGDLKTAVLRARPTNPALERLRGRVLAHADVCEVITSYDRMHHRHSRS